MKPRGECFFVRVATQSHSYNITLMRRNHLLAFLRGDFGNYQKVRQ